MNLSLVTLVVFLSTLAPSTWAAFRPRDSKLKCEPSLTTISGLHGTAAPGTQLCSGDLVFEDNFDILDFETWEHEITMASGAVCRFKSFFRAFPLEEEDQFYFRAGNSNFSPTIVQILSPSKGY